MPDSGHLECDLLVIGAGMAGLTAAARASRAGARPIVIERAPVIGGSARLSSGYLWTLESVAEFARIDPEGDRALQTVIVDEFPRVVDAVRATGVEMSPRIPVLDGAGHQIDIRGYLGRCRGDVLAVGGEVVVDAEVEALERHGDTVVGARVADGSMTVDIRAPWTLIATGGFANDAELLLAHTRAGGRLRARAGAFCRGDGLRLARSVGGAFAPENDAFYGHLVAWQVTLDDAARWDTLTLLHSRASLLVDECGERFTEETRGDNVSALATAARGLRGLLLWDENIHRDFVLLSWPPGNAGVDKFEIAVRHGGVGQKCEDLEALYAYANDHGFDGAHVAATIAAFNDRQSASPSGSRGEQRPIRTAPFYALVVEPTITFPYAGVRVDVDARVLRSDGTAVEGLLAAGVDIGNIYREGYAGGLALAGSFAMRSMRTAGLG